eukprot:CAMPEP_0197522760 /NCGR_PEP_ID=MMETSP1318-20131121/7840_1 /TAXON_ID=552666 /ORGANISM="Partenskyella glossopodia, Strain RCC365" /LENGTH=239 /DNA_ID=CAMNT_0043075231 /DNA_START=272 /DNA_END=991 /DNA_ORIENTATION=-
MPDSNTVVVGSWDNSVYVYSISQGAIVGEGRTHEDAVSSVALSEGRVLSGSWDGCVKLWQLRQSRLDPRPLLDLYDHEHPIMCVCMDATSRLACSASQDGVVILWDLRTGTRQRTIKAHKREVTGIALSNTGYDVTTVSSDGRVKMFDVTKGDCFLDINTGEALSCVRTDGDVIFTAGESGCVKLWDVNHQDSEEKARICTNSFGHKLAGVSLSRDGEWMAAGIENESGTGDLGIFKSI